MKEAENRAMYHHTGTSLYARIRTLSWSLYWKLMLSPFLLLFRALIFLMVALIVGHAKRPAHASADV